MPKCIICLYMYIYKYVCLYRYTDKYYIQQNIHIHTMSTIIVIVMIKRMDHLRVYYIYIYMTCPSNTCTVIHNNKYILYRCIVYVVRDIRGSSLDEKMQNKKHISTVRFIIIIFFIFFFFLRCLTFETPVFQSKNVSIYMYIKCV